MTAESFSRQLRAFGDAVTNQVNTMRNSVTVGIQNVKLSGSMYGCIQYVINTLETIKTRLRARLIRPMIAVNTNRNNMSINT